MADLIKGDFDNDGVGDGTGGNCGIDNCPDIPNPDQADRDGNGIGDACEPEIEPDPEPELDPDPEEPTDP